MSQRYPAILPRRIVALGPRTTRPPGHSALLTCFTNGRASMIGSSGAEYEVFPQGWTWNWGNPGGVRWVRWICSYPYISIQTVGRVGVGVPHLPGLCAALTSGTRRFFDFREGRIFKPMTTCACREMSL